jgi:hypothetical protein
MRWIVSIIFLFFVWQLPAQQDAMMQGKKKQKRIWKRWSQREKKNKTAYNPYLRMKKKHLPSQRIAKGNRKEIRAQRKTYKKQLKAAKRQGNR